MKTTLRFILLWMLCAASMGGLRAQNFVGELSRACRAGDSLAVAKVLQSHSAENKETYNGGENLRWMGFSPAFYATQAKCAGCVRRLAEADLILRNERVDNKLPLLTYALQQKHAPTVQALLAAGVAYEPYIKRETEHPLYEALVMQRSPQAARMLFDAGADVNQYVSGKQQQTAMHYAAQIGNVDFIRYLLDKGAELDPTDKRGNPPIVYAFYFKDQPEVVQAFIDAGADLSVQVSGKNLVQMAEKLERTQSLQVLRKAGVGKDATID
jgi:ankyrin repeat protein